MRTRNAIPSAGADHLGDALFIRIFGEQNERHGDTGFPEFRDQTQGPFVRCRVGKQNEAIARFQHHLLRFFDRPGVVEDGHKHVVAPQNLAD